MLKHIACGNDDAWLRMRQISAEMVGRRMALDEAKHSYSRAIIMAQIKRREAEACKDTLTRDLLLIDASEQKNRADNILVKVEGALKEVIALARMHDTLAASLGDVSESAFELGQVRSHIARAFTQAARDVRVNGRIGVGNIEYIEQIGINASMAQADVEDFVRSEMKSTDRSSSLLHHWIGQMQEKYSSVAADRCQRLGYDPTVDGTLTFEPR